MRIENKTLRLDLETVDMNEKVRNVIKDTRNVIESNGRRYSDYNIVFEPEVPVLPVSADRTKAYEILSNLISNAIAHSKQGGTITVTAKPSDGFAVVSVRDEGSGIDPDVLPRLFNKFATKSGTGLGVVHLKELRRGPRRQDLGREQQGWKGGDIHLHPAPGDRIRAEGYTTINTRPGYRLHLWSASIERPAHLALSDVRPQFEAWGRASRPGGVYFFDQGSKIARGCTCSPLSDHADRPKIVARSWNPGDRHTGL